MSGVGRLHKRKQYFKLSVRNLVTWNGLIAGYAEQGLGDEALSCFAHMQKEGLSPDSFTFVCLLQACGTIGAVEKDAEIHAEVDEQRLFGKKYPDKHCIGRHVQEMRRASESTRSVR